MFERAALISCTQYKGDLFNTTDLLDRPLILQHASLQEACKTGKRQDQCRTAARKIECRFHPVSNSRAIHSHKKDALRLVYQSVDLMASNVVAGAVCCCSVPCPKTRFEKRVLLVGGVLNIVVPCGMGSIIAGCWLRDNQLISTGVLQLVLTVLVVGVIWSIVYGGLMLLSAFTVTLSSPPSQPPLSTALTPSRQMPSGSLQYQYREPQKSRYHNHTYTSLSPAGVTEKSVVVAMEEIKSYSPRTCPSAVLQSGILATEVDAKDEEVSAETKLVNQPQTQPVLYHEGTCA